MTRLEIALTVVQQLRDEGYNVVIAGGAARDILHRREPKDFDIVMMDELSIDEALVWLDDAVGGVCGIEPFGNGASMAGCEDAKLDWVIKFKVGVGLMAEYVEFDLIQHKRHPTTPEEVVQCFDCNINQAWLADTRAPGALYAVEAVADYPMWNGGFIKALPLCDYPQARMAYLREKYPQYTWPSDAELQSHPNYHKG